MAPELGFSDYQPIILSYVSEGIRRDEEKLKFSPTKRLTELLKAKGGDASLAIAVNPEFHGKGIGKTLMEAAIDLADNWLNLTRLELEVNEDNLTAITFYKRMGFDVEGTKRLSTFKSDSYINTVIMSRINPTYQLGANK